MPEDEVKFAVLFAYDLNEFPGKPQVEFCPSLTIIQDSEAMIKHCASTWAFSSLKSWWIRIPDMCGVD